MRIGVLSDSHDNVWKLEAAAIYLSKSDAVLHCGDVISPFMIERLSKLLPGLPIYIVWGNNDGDKRALHIMAKKTSNIHLMGEFASLNFKGFRVAVSHYPEIAKPLALSGQYDLVCYGHDHIAHHEVIEGTHLLNPGELLGLFGRSTVAVFDTNTMTVQFEEVK